jgi:hypothetical protein
MRFKGEIMPEETKTAPKRKSSKAKEPVVEQATPPEKKAPVPEKKASPPPKAKEVVSTPVPSVPVVQAPSHSHEDLLARIESLEARINALKEWHLLEISGRCSQSRLAAKIRDL